MDNATISTTAATETSRGALVRGFASMLFADVGLVVLAYYGARLAGANEYLALWAGALASVGRLLWGVFRARRIDPFAMFLLVMFGAGIGLSLVTGDPRFLLAKAAIMTGVAGLVLLGSCLTSRPLCYYAACRMVGPVRGAELRARTERDPAMRRRWSQVTAVWGGGLVVEAALRLLVIYLLSLDIAVGASNVVMVLGYGLLAFWTVRTVKQQPASPKAAASHLS